MQACKRILQMGYDSQCNARLMTFCGMSQYICLIMKMSHLQHQLDNIV